MTMRIAGVIFSRFDSTRLFGKALMDIEGRCLLGRVLDRTKKVDGIDKIIIATSNREIDDTIVQFAEREGVEVFRGSCEDVYGRALAACEEHNLDAFARICGDRPLFDHQLVSHAVKLYRSKKYDLVTTMCPRTAPPGFTTEVISHGILKKFNGIILSKANREHVTDAFYKDNKMIRLKNISETGYLNCLDLSFVVDTPQDLKKIRWITNKIDSLATDNEMQQIVQFAKLWGEEVLERHTGDIKQ